MEYLQNTVKFLSEENLQLKQKLRRMTDLNQLITNQRQTEQRDYLHRFHQEEIAVIREIAENHEKSLKAEIKKLNMEVVQLNASVQKGLDCIAELRRQVKRLQNQKESLKEHITDLQAKILEGQQRQQMSLEQFEIHYARLEQEYQCRQQEVMEKYMAKLQESNDRHEEEIRKQTKFTDFLQNKLNNAEKEKELLTEQVNRLIATLTQQEQKISVKNKSASQEVNELRKQNGNLKVYIKNLQMEIVQLQSLKQKQCQKACKWQSQCMELKVKQRELQRSKNKQIQRQKSKSKSIAKDLSQQRKYMKEIQEKQRKKEADFNQSKKLLINKIRQIQHKYQNQKSKMSILQKTNTKTAKKNMQTFQSASLDTSFHRQKQSPSVSCFLNPDKPSIKKNLKIDTSSHSNLLRLKDLDTPCFQSAKSTQIKKTIKIRK